MPGFSSVKMKEKIGRILKESIAVKEQLLKEAHAQKVQEAAKAIIKALKDGGKVILFGNGGSAADSQHIAAELVGRFKRDRQPLAALALTTNSSTLTAITNDYGYEQSFSRQIQAIAKKEDVVVGISTSGKSQNVAAGIEQARKLGAKTIALTGGDGGKLPKLAQISIVVPSKSTPRIQEAHITIGHIICELVEEHLFPSSKARK